MKSVLFAVERKTMIPIKIVSWLYKEPGILDSVSSISREYKPADIIPIGIKKYRKIMLASPENNQTLFACRKKIIYNEK